MIGTEEEDVEEGGGSWMAEVEDEETRDDVADRVLLSFRILDILSLLAFVFGVVDSCEDVDFDAVRVG